MARKRTDSLALVVHVLSPIALFPVFNRRAKNDSQPIWLRSLLLVALIITSYSLQRSIETAESTPSEALQALSENQETGMPTEPSANGDLPASASTLESAERRLVESDIPSGRLENGDIVFLSQDRSQPLWLSRMLSQAGVQVKAGTELRAAYTNVGIVTTQGEQVRVVHVPMGQSAIYEVIEEPLTDYLSRGSAGRVVVYRLKAPTADLQQAIATAASAYHQKMTVAPTVESPRLLSLRELGAELGAELAEGAGATNRQVCGSLVLDAYLAADVDLMASQSANSADAPLVDLVDFWLGDRCPTPESLASHANLRLVSQFLPASSVQSSLD